MSELASFPSLPSLAAAIADPVSPISHSPSQSSCSSSSSSRSPPHSSPARPQPPQPHSQPTAARASAAVTSHSTAAAEQARDTESGGEEKGRKRARRQPDDEQSDNVQVQQSQHNDTSTAATLAAIGRRWDELLQLNRALHEENERLKNRVQQLEQRLTNGSDQVHSLDSPHRQRSQQQPLAASISLHAQPAAAVASESPQHDQSIVDDAMPIESEKAEQKLQYDSSESQDPSEAFFRMLFEDKSAGKKRRRSETKADDSHIAAPAEPLVAARASQASAVRTVAEESKAAPAPSQPPISEADRLLLEMDDVERQPQAAVHEPHSMISGRHELQQPNGADPFATQTLSPPQPPSPHQRPQAQQSHALTDDDVRVRLADARHERKRANEMYNNDQLQQAIDHYNRADSMLAALPATDAVTIELHLLLASRAPVYIKLPEPGLALADAERLMTIKPQWWKSFALKARALAALHRMEAAQAVFQAGLQCDMSSDERDRLLEKKADFERKWQKFKADNVRKAAATPTTSIITTARSPPTSPIPSSETSTASIASSASSKSAFSAPLSGTSTTSTTSSAPSRTALSTSFTEPTAVTARTALAPLPPSSLDAYYNHSHVLEPHYAARLPPLPEQAEEEQRPHSPLSTSPLPSTPSKLSVQPYAVLPRVTMEGVRDLLGDDGLMMAEEWVEAVHAIKVKREDDDEQSGAAVVLVQARCKRWLPRDRAARKRKRAAVSGRGDGDRGVDSGDESSPSMLDVLVRFEGNHVTSWKCSCHQPPADQPLQATQLEAEEDETTELATPIPAESDDVLADHVNHELVPCKHVGAALLLVRRKQSHATTPPNSSPDTASLYVHPSHALPASVTATLPSLASQYSSMTVSQLRQLLHLNGDKVTGVKEELVQRCVEGTVRGVLPACDRCGGRRYYCNGYVHCRGVFDVVRKRRVQCLLHWPEQAVPRRPWKQ